MGKKQGRSYHSLTGKSSLNARLYSVSVFIIYCIYHGTYTYSVSLPLFVSPRLSFRLRVIVAIKSLTNGQKR